MFDGIGIKQQYCKNKPVVSIFNVESTSATCYVSVRLSVSIRNLQRYLHRNHKQRLLRKIQAVPTT